VKRLRTWIVVLVILETGFRFTPACKKLSVNQPPATPPVPSGVTSGRFNASYEFRTTTTDQDGDSVCFRFQWGDGVVSEWSNWVASGDTAAMSHLWADTGTFLLKTQATDPQDLTSAWSASLTVSITPNHPPDTSNHAPDTPAVPSGPSAAPKDSLCQFSAIATDPDGDNLSYRFDWGNGDTSGWGSWHQSGHAESAACAYPRSGSYEVRAQARDVDDACSAWSDPLSVTVTNPYPPSAPFCWAAGSSEGGRGESLAFSSTASDSGGDSISIRLSWGDGDTSDWSAVVRSGEVVRMVHAWQDTGEFAVRAQARDEESLASNWSWPATASITRRKWRYQTGGEVLSSPAIADDGTVYFGSEDGCLYAINPDGSLKWRYRTGDIVCSSPVIAADGTVYFGSIDRYLYAINANGSFRWRYRTGDCVSSSPAVAGDGTVYVGSNDRYLYAVNPNGSLKWRFWASEWVQSTPAVAADGTVYVGSLDSHVYAVHPDGSLMWSYWVGDCITSPAVASDGTVYVGSQDNSLYAINPSGSLRWRCPTGGDVGSPAIAADGTVYVGSYDHSVYAIRPDGSYRWSYQTGRDIISAPAIAADGTVYVGSWDKYLYAFEGDSPLADTPWPRFHHDNKNTGRVGGGQR